MERKSWIGCIIACLLLLACSNAVTLVAKPKMGLTQPTQAVSSVRESATDEAERAREASSVLTEIVNVPEEGIPDQLLERAKAIAVIPHVVKGAFGSIALLARRSLVNVLEAGGGKRSSVVRPLRDPRSTNV